MDILTQRKVGLLILMDLPMRSQMKPVNGMIQILMASATISSILMAKHGAHHIEGIAVKQLLDILHLTDGVVLMPMVMAGQTQQQTGWLAQAVMVMHGHKTQPNGMTVMVMEEVTIH